MSLSTTVSTNCVQDVYIKTVIKKVKILKTVKLKCGSKPAKNQKTREFRIVKISEDTCWNVLIRIFRRINGILQNHFFKHKKKTKSKVI